MCIVQSLHIPKKDLVLAYILGITSKPLLSCLDRMCLFTWILGQHHIVYANYVIYGWSLGSVVISLTPGEDGNWRSAMQVVSHAYVITLNNIPRHQGLGELSSLVGNTPCMLSFIIAGRIKHFPHDSTGRGQLKLVPGSPGQCPMCLFL